MSEGGFYPPNLSVAPVQPTAAPQGVPVGSRDQVIVDIPRKYDSAFAPQDYDSAQIDATLARTSGETAAPFDPEAYERAQAKARADAEAAEGTDPDDVETILDLSDEERADLGDAFMVGKRKGHITVLGHRIDCQTLNSMDEMNVGRFVKPYMDSPGFVRAWTVANAAAGIRRIDGKRIYEALAPIEDESELFEEKVRLVARAYPYIITPVYDRIQELDAEFAAIAERLNSGKISG